MPYYEKAVSLWRARHIATEADLAQAIQGHCIAYAYHSCKMENPNVTYKGTQEIFERDAVSNYTGDLHTFLEIRNAWDAHRFLLKVFGNRHPIEEPLVCAFHRLLTQAIYDTRRLELGEQPGTYKHRAYRVGRLDIGTAPENVQREMATLLGEFRDLPASIAEVKQLDAAAYFLARFEHIHPFADGNGRTGELLMNYLRLLLDHPPIVLHAEDSMAYQAALDAWGTAETLTPLHSFLQAQTVKAWQLVEAGLQSQPGEHRN